MSLTLEKIVSQLQHLPEPTLREVSDFIDFLVWRQQMQPSPRLSESPELMRDEVPLLNIAGSLSGEPLSVQDIDDELYGHGS